MEQKLRNIVMILLQNGPKGISELVKETGYDKKTVIKYCNQLKFEKLVSKNGKFGKYHITTNAYQYPLVKGGIFQMEVMRQIFWPSRNKIAFRRDIKYYRTQLSEFASNMAYFIVYSLIKSMAPNTWNPKIDNMKLDKNILGIGKDTAIKEWINRCISPSQILIEFCNLDIIKEGLSWGVAIPPPSLHKFLKTLQSTRYANQSPERKRILKKNLIKIWEDLNKSYTKNTRKDFNPQDPYQSRFELDEEVYNLLAVAFKEMNPTTYEKLDKIWIELDDEIKRQISFAKVQNTTKRRRKVATVE